jgi:hypothetical protein
MPDDPKPELILDALPERRFVFDSLAECARARTALKAQILELENALILLDYIEKGFEPVHGVS